MLGFHSLMTCLRLSLLTNTIAPQVNPAVVHQKVILCQWSLPCSCVLFGFYMLEKANDDQWTLAVSHTYCLCWQLGNTPWTPTWPYGSSTKIFPILPDVEITLDIQKSWSWASNRELFSALHVEGLPKPVTSAKNLGSFSVTLTRTRPMCLRKTDIKMQSNDSANYPNFTFLSVTNYIWLWPQFYPNGDILVKPMWLIGRSCINFNGPLLILCGNSQ